MPGALEYRGLQPEYDAALAAIIRSRLKEHGLDIPGTVYFDESLDHLSAFYSGQGRIYYVLMNGETVIGGFSLAELGDFPVFFELPKPYIAESVSGLG